MLLSRGLVVVAVLLALPVLGVLGAWFQLDAARSAALSHLATTVLPAYAGTSMMLVLGVALGAGTLGAAAATAVTLFDFPLRRTLEWALLLPLAMPAYVLAYAYTDFLQFSGPLQTALRARMGWQGALWPDVRSLGGAIVLFVLCLYPYVYLLTRAALADRGVALMEAARLLGAGTARRLREVALPLARPAVVAGVALVAMETLADYGVGAYFGLGTFTTGIYKAWLVMDDRAAAAQLASALLVLVAAALWLEHRSRRELRFVSGRSGARRGQEAQPVRLRGRAAVLALTVTTVPVLLGFVLPVLVLLQLLAQQWAAEGTALPLGRFAGWAWNSFKLAGLAALAAAALALALGFALRMTPQNMQAGRSIRHSADATALRWSAATVSLGYAVPGAVIAVGILLPLGWVQARWPESGAGAWITGTVLGVLYAYLVRFAAAAFQSVQAGYARIPASIDESARSLGTGRWRLLTELHLPLMQRSLLAALLLVFVDVMKELPATLVLRPFDSDTLAVVAYQLARDERLAEAALPSLAIVLVGLLPVVLLSRAMRRVA
jgi:iron(III) transport system permease protein